MLEIINVHVAVNGQSKDYLNYLIENFKHTATYSERLFFFVYALDPEAYAYFSNDPRLSNNFEVYNEKKSYRLKTWAEWKIYLKFLLGKKNGLGGSNGHAAGINHMMTQLEMLDGYHVIADSDVAMLMHGWDVWMIKELEAYDLIGTPYEPISGFSSGTSQVQTYKDFPNPIWMAIHKKIDITKMDWMPNKEENIEIDSEEKGTLYNLPVGYELVCDVGWRLPKFCKSHSIRAKAFQQVKPSSDKIKILRTSQDYNEEYQYSGRAVVGHQRGGSRHNFRASKVSTRFYECVEQAVGAPGTTKSS